MSHIDELFKETFSLIPRSELTQDAMGKFSGCQIDIFLFFLRKQGFTFHTNYNLHEMSNPVF